MKKTASKTRKFVVILAGLVQQFITMGLGYGLSVIYPELINVFNEKRWKAALIQGLYMGLSTGCGVFMTGVIMRVGPGITIIVGSVITTTGFFVSSFARNLTTIIVCTGVIGGLGMCTCYLAAFISISWMFHEDPGFPLVCLTVGSSVGHIVIPYLYELFISEYGWSGAFILLSGLALQCAPFGLLIYTSKDYFVTDNNKEPSYSSVSDGYIALLKDKLIWILLVDSLIISLTGYVEFWFIVDIVMSRGYSRESGSVLVSAIGLATFIGCISGCTVRYKCTTIPTVYHWLWICPIIACGHALVISMTDYWAIFAACIVQGAAIGMNFSQTPAIMFEASGLATYPQAMSLVNVVDGLGIMLMEVIGGITCDNSGKYDISFYIAIGLTVLVTFNSAIASFITRGRKKSFQPEYESLE